MRHAFIAQGSGLSIGLHHVACAPSLDEEASMATELRCEGQDGTVAYSCRELHEKLYQAGRLDPEKSSRLLYARPHQGAGAQAPVGGVRRALRQLAGGLIPG